jgi:hypothetical protein
VDTGDGNYSYIEMIIGSDANDGTERDWTTLREGDVSFVSC